MGFSRIRGETRPDVYREVEEAFDVRRASVTEQEDDARPVEDFAQLADGLLALAQGLRQAGAPLVEFCKLYAEAAAVLVAGLESIARRPGGRS